MDGDNYYAGRLTAASAAANRRTNGIIIVRLRRISLMSPRSPRTPQCCVRIYANHPSVVVRHYRSLISANNSIRSLGATEDVIQRLMYSRATGANARGNLGGTRRLLGVTMTIEQRPSDDRFFREILTLDCGRDDERRRVNIAFLLSRPVPRVAALLPCFAYFPIRDL